MGMVVGVRCRIYGEEMKEQIANEADRLFPGYGNFPIFLEQDKQWYVIIYGDAKQSSFYKVKDDLENESAFLFQQVPPLF